MQALTALPDSIRKEVFFFEKKKQKTFWSLGPGRFAATATSRNS
jgi:hypothetical protein